MTNRKRSRIEKRNRNRVANRTSNLGYWLSDARAEFPDRIGVIDLSGATPREVTYAELDERMDRVANLLGSRSASETASSSSRSCSAPCAAARCRCR